MGSTGHTAGLRSTIVPRARVVRSIAGLKWALIMGGAKGSLQSRTQLAISVVLSFVFGISALVLLGTVGGTTVADDALIVVLAGSSIGIGLLSAATGVETSLDPRQLATEPLSPVELGLGMLAAALVGPPAILAALCGVGIFVGWRNGSPAADAVLLISIALWWATLLLFSRTTANLLGMWATGRFRQIAQAAATASALIGWLAVQLMTRYQENWNAAGLRMVARFARFTPPGQLGVAIAEGGGRSVVPLLLGASWLPLLVWMSIRSTARLITVPAVVTNGRSMKAGSRGLRGRFLFVERIAPGPVGAVALRSLMTKIRTPRQAVNTLTAVVVGGGVMVLLPLLDGEVVDPRMVMLGGLLQFAVLFDGNNSFGVDGPALWSEIQAGADGRTLVRAKVLTSVLTIGPFALVIPVVLAAIGNGWQWLPAATLIGVGAVTSAAGVAVVTSSMVPVAMPVSANPLAAGDTGQGCAASLLLAISIMFLMAVTVPLTIVVYALSDRSTLLTTGVSTLAVVVGLAVMRGGIWLAEGQLNGKEAALVDKVTPRR